jgi:hypothetical protein
MFPNPRSLRPGELLLRLRGIRQMPANYGEMEI